MAKKIKKYADGGMASLGSLLGGLTPASTTSGSPRGSGGLGGIGGVASGGGGGGGGSAQSGLDAINQGASDVGAALGQISSAIGGGGSPTYKKGGAVKIPKSKISTGERSSGRKCAW